MFGTDAARLQSESLSAVDPAVFEIVRREDLRQLSQIILIASESICPAPVREALAGSFTNIYAEGYPSPRMRKSSEDSLLDFEMELAYHRRYSDRRYYKGCDFVNFIEALAMRRAAELFANERVPAGDIHVNVQPLSGAAANNAIYTALVRPGDTVLSMALNSGGHLSHGSPVNRSGIFYRIVNYEIDRETGRLNYEKIRALALQHRPRMIIAGFSAYPWDIDWEILREIADEVPGGCVLVADIAHTAGLVAAGLLKSPIGYAHVVSCTTHKTLCGPRGAVILTTSEELASKIDSAVFPGEQGGPHINSIAAKAVCFRLAMRDDFKRLMKRVIDNAKVLSSSLAREGLEIAYGGTETHLFLVDLRSVQSPTGVILTGEIASRILDLCGITLNKNTIAGDTNAAHPSGIRIGTTWVSQLGMGKEQMKTLARIIARVLKSIRPFTYTETSGEVGRGKIPIDVLKWARQEVDAVLGAADSGVKEARMMRKSGASGKKMTGIIEIRGDAERVRAFLQEASTGDIYALRPGQKAKTLFLDEKGRFLAAAAVGCREEKDHNARFLISVWPEETAPRLREWLVGLSDGYVLFDEDDIFVKIQGPVVVDFPDGQDVFEDSMVEDLAGLSGEIGEELKGPRDADIMISKRDSALREYICEEKPYFIGKGSLSGQGAVRLRSPENFRNLLAGPEAAAERRLPLEGMHLDMGAVRSFIRAGAYLIPSHYGDPFSEYRTTRECAGIFDLSHMGIFEISGPFATRFLDLATTNYIAALEPGQSCYSFLLLPSGAVVDDVLIFRMDRDRYMLVCNARNEQKVEKWLSALALGSVSPPLFRLEGPVEIVNLKSHQAGKRQRVHISVQGPASAEVVAGALELKDSLPVRRNEFSSFNWRGAEIIISRTGYTGEEIGYEIFICPALVEELWRRIISAGESIGARPAGAEAREMLRIEAGLPLHGRELGGDLELSPLECGYGAFVKLHKAFFVGREAMKEQKYSIRRRVVRFAAERMDDSARPGYGNQVLTADGRRIGSVTSCAILPEKVVGMACVDADGTYEGKEIVISCSAGRKIAAKVIPRFYIHAGTGLADRSRERPLSMISEMHE